MSYMDSHANEYAAAAAGMQETYGTGWHDTTNTLPAVGDFVSGVTAGKRWSGRVLSSEPHRLAVECDGAWIVVHPRDATH
jgi:hypothetical protein